MQIFKVLQRVWCRTTHRGVTKGASEETYLWRLEGLYASVGVGAEYMRILYRMAVTYHFCAVCGRRSQVEVSNKDLAREHITISKLLLITAVVKNLDKYHTLEDLVRDGMICKEHGYPFIKLGPYYPNSHERCECKECQKELKEKE